MPLALRPVGRVDQSPASLDNSSLDNLSLNNLSYSFANCVVKNKVPEKSTDEEDNFVGMS